MTSCMFSCRWSLNTLDRKDLERGLREDVAARLQTRNPTAKEEHAMTVVRQWCGLRAQPLHGNAALQSGRTSASETW
jgi:hypothetical protein